MDSNIKGKQKNNSTEKHSNHKISLVLCMKGRQVLYQNFSGPFPAIEPETQLWEKVSEHKLESNHHLNTNLIY